MLQAEEKKEFVRRSQMMDLQDADTNTDPSG